MDNKTALRGIRNFAIILTLMVVSATVGYDIGRRKIGVSITPRQAPFVKIENKYPPEKLDISFNLFWDVWERINQQYIDRDEINKQNLVYGAIKGMVSAVGDPYTVFLPPDDQQRSKEDLAGSFEGIGAQLGMKEGHIMVVAPLKGLPAEIAGLLPGDYIIEVEAEDTTGWTLPEAVNKIRGEGGTVVTLTIVREGENESLKIPITRGTINVPSIETQLIAADCSSSNSNGGDFCETKTVEDCTNCAQIAILQLSRFGGHTNSEWQEAVDQIIGFREKAAVEKKNFKGMILDLRNNPGGFLQSAVFISSEFIESGTVVQQKDATGAVEKYDVERAGRLLDIPVVVLINAGSASASEIVAGALRDHKRATLVGVKSFGKGSVQEAQELSENAGLHVTIAKWLTPNGDSINKNGIDPDVVIEYDRENPDLDKQFAKALEVLVK